MDCKLIFKNLHRLHHDLNHLQNQDEAQRLKAILSKRNVSTRSFEGHSPEPFEALEPETTTDTL